MSMVKSRKKGLVITAIAAVLVLAGGGAAFAFWTSSGSGTGSATSGQSVAFTVTSLEPVGDPLSPGGPGQSVSFTVDNPGTGTQNLSSVTVAIATADGSEWLDAPGCTAADYSVVIDDGLVYGDIAGGAGVSGTATITMLDTGVNQDACQGATLPLYFLAS